MSAHDDDTVTSDKASDLSNNNDTFSPIVENGDDDDDVYNDTKSEVSQSTDEDEENKDLDINRESQSEQNDATSVKSPYALESMASHSFVSARQSSKPLLVSSEAEPGRSQLSGVASGRQGLISQILPKSINEPTADELALTSYMPSQSVLPQTANEGALQQEGSAYRGQAESSKLPSTNGAPDPLETDKEPPEISRIWVRRHTSIAVNKYANLENTQGFVGAAALAFAAIPAPKSLMAAGQYFFNNDDDEIFDANGKDRPEPRPTAAANVKFKREHTKRQIFKRRLKTFRFLVKEYVKLFGKYVMTLKGFAVTLYFLLVIAFGGMLFLLLCNAAPAMSREWGPNNKEHSPRQIWMEIDSQILNALFSITGLGLFPIRLRDLYLWIRGRYLGDQKSSAKILKIHSKWFWLGFTSEWKLMTVILLYIFNSIFQVLMCFVMWNYNRYTRPPWATGTLIGASFGCTIGAGIIMFLEAKRIDKYSFQTGNVRVQGVPFSESEFQLKGGDKANADFSGLQTAEPGSSGMARDSVVVFKNTSFFSEKPQEGSKGLDTSNLV